MENVYNGIIMTGIYKITFPNGVYYFGQAIDLKRRERQHIKEAQKGKHTNPRFQHCWNKYEEFNFEIIAECKKEELNKIESDFIIKNIDNELCCNMCKEGRSRLGVKLPEESKQKMSKYQFLIGRTKPVYVFSRQMDLLGKFNSMRDAEKILKLCPKDVQKSCKNRGKYNAKGYKFLYAAEVDIFLNYSNNIVKL